MRILNATLAANLTNSIATPAVSATIGDRYLGIARPRWEVLHTGTSNPGPVALVTSYDGSMIRFRMDSGTIHYQRITDPTIAAQWAAWSTAATGAATDRGFAVAWDGNSRMVLVFITTDTTAIKSCDATVPVTSWTAPATVYTAAAGHEITAVAATLNAGCETLYILAADEVTATQLTTVHTFTRAETGTTYSAPTDWGRAATTRIYSLAVDGVGNLDVAASLDTHILAYCVPLASLNAWPDPLEVIRSENPASTFHYLSIDLSGDYLYNLYYVDHNTTEATDTLNHLTSATWASGWSLIPRPYVYTAAYGASVLADLTYRYLATSTMVYRAKRWDAADPTQQVDVTADLLALTAREQNLNTGTLTLIIRNDDGRYATDLTATSQQAIRRGSQVHIAIGYTISGADLTSHLPPYWITSIEHNRERHRSNLIITAQDTWDILRTTLSPRAITYTNQTALQIITSILTGLGLYVEEDGAAAWDTNLPTFTIQSNRPLSTPIIRLLDIAGGNVQWRTDEDWIDHHPSAKAYLFIPTLSAAYTFGTAHQIASATYATRTQDVNTAQAQGYDPTITNPLPSATAHDWTDIDLMNAAHHQTILDRRYLDAATLQQIADAAIHVAQTSSRRAAITVDPHPGLEILDTVNVQDDIIALNQDYLVTGITTTLDRTKAVYSQTIELANPWT